jgi:L,D-peptidoglycan transpeptidase YkuD (ErfK/YbiS/YcfS/YnhG family)
MRAKKSKHMVTAYAQPCVPPPQRREAPEGPTFYTMRRTTFTLVRVRPRAGNRSQGWLTLGSLPIPVALGRSGIRANKREGDGGTPRGAFRPVRLWWRPDRSPRPVTLLPVRPIRPSLAWCEDPTDRRYNRPVERPAGKSGDRLWRDDALYDYIIEIDHNIRPLVRGRGSAVFIHVARAGLRPTAGCVALEPGRLRQFIGHLGRRTRIVIQ